VLEDSAREAALRLLPFGRDLLDQSVSRRSSFEIQDGTSSPTPKTSQIAVAMPTDS
jgi:hypothetical protein